jgi:VanZ family protein
MKKPLFILPIALSIVRRYPLSLLCIALIWFLSLMPFFPETPFDNVQFIDKWTHLVMYGGTCGVIWWEYLRHHQQLNKRKLLLCPLLGMIALGGVMELLQAYCTTTRSGEWLDFYADTVGVLLGNGVGLLMNVLYFKRQ